MSNAARRDAPPGTDVTQHASRGLGTLASSLERLYHDYNREDSAADPVQLVRPFSRPEDREIAGVLRRGAGVRPRRQRAGLDLDALPNHGRPAGAVRARASIRHSRTPSCARWCIDGRGASTSPRCSGSFGRCSIGPDPSRRSSPKAWESRMSTSAARSTASRGARSRSTCGPSTAGCPSAPASAIFFRGRRPAAPASG